jgi:hypothetical protein
MSVRQIACLIMALGLAACGNNSDVRSDNAATESVTPVEAETEVTDGRVVISALPKVSEPNACILPITITNGTDDTTTVSMMQFTITGPGEDDSGNMFAQTVAPGETNTARLLFPTRQCDDLLEITAPNLTCRVGETDCSEDVEFEATEGLSFKRG